MYLKNEPLKRDFHRSLNFFHGGNPKPKMIITILNYESSKSSKNPLLQCLGRAQNITNNGKGKPFKLLVCVSQTLKNLVVEKNQCF